MRSTPVALALALGIGAASALQAFINGRFGRALDSPILAVTINNFVATLGALVIVLAIGALARGPRALLARPRLPGWCYLGGLAGAAVVLVSAIAAPTLGVALLTVAFVCGITTGSVPIDAAGLGPGAPRPPSTTRIAGVVLAISATAIGALGARGNPQPLLLALAICIGAGAAFQSAANGRLAVKSGEPFFASLINSALGLIVLASITAIVLLRGTTIGDFPANPLLYIGGVLGAYIVSAGVFAVQALGVLRMSLAIVAGQSTGALVIDLIAPAPGEAPTIATAVGVALAIAAVAISGVRRRPD